MPRPGVVAARQDPRGDRWHDPTSGKHPAGRTAKSRINPPRTPHDPHAASCRMFMRHDRFLQTLHSHLNPPPQDKSMKQKPIRSFPYPASPRRTPRPRGQRLAAINNWNTATGTWDTSTANWSSPTTWTNGNDAVFSNTATASIITLSSGLTAGSVMVGNGGNNANYTFTGSGLSATTFTVQGNGGNNLGTQPHRHIQQRQHHSQWRSQRRPRLPQHHREQHRLRQHHRRPCGCGMEARTGAR